MILIGNHSNEYILEMLRISINPLNMNWFKESWLPSFAIDNGFISIK